MKPMQTLRTACARLRALDPRALMILTASLLLALASLYLMIWRAGKAGAGCRRAAACTSGGLHRPVRDERGRVRDAEISQLDKLIADESAGQTSGQGPRKAPPANGLDGTEATVEASSARGDLKIRWSPSTRIRSTAGANAVADPSDAARILELAARETGQSGATS
jgi:hypothetical protein